jgi:EmrB/QacA subfamily drug resistance transporter
MVRAAMSSITEPSAPTASARAAARATSPRTKAAAAVLLAAALTAQLDLFIVNVAIPDLRDAFPGTGLSTLSWTLDAYTVVFAAALIPAGRLADELGRGRTLLLGVGVFTASSLACALAPSIGALIAFRATQAVGAAMVMPASLALLLEVVGEERRPQIVGLWAGMGGAAAALGPSVGGLLLEAGWRWIFIVNVPVGAFALLLGAAVLPPDRGARGEAPPDLLGAAALAAAVGLLVAAMVEGSGWGWGSVRWWATVAGAGAFAAAFLRRNARHAAPMVDWSLLRVRAYAAANVAAFAFYLAMACMILEAFLFLQGEWGYSALTAGLAFAPGGLMSMVCAIGCGRLMNLVGRRRLAAVGPVFLAAGGLWWLLLLGDSPDYLTGFLPGVLLAGVGTGTSQAPLFASVSFVPPGQSAAASAQLTAVRQVASSLGVALLVTIVGAAAGLTGFRLAWALVAVGSLLSSLVSALVAAPGRQRAGA